MGYLPLKVSETIIYFVKETSIFFLNVFAPIVPLSRKAPLQPSIAFCDICDFLQSKSDVSFNDKSQPEML